MLKNYFYFYLMFILVGCSTKNNQNSIFKDENLEYVVREALNKKSGELTIEELSSISEIGCNCCDDLSGIENLKNLKILRLTDSNLSNIDSLKGLKNLECLDLRDNKITNISAIGGLENLKELRIDINNIRDISTLTKLLNIEKIVAYGNMIQIIPDFTNCTKLKYVDLSYNELVFNKNFYSLKNVDELWLCKNKINQLNWVPSLKRLNYLNIGNNPIKCDEINPETRKLITNGVIQTDCSAEH